MAELGPAADASPPDKAYHTPVLLAEVLEHARGAHRVVDATVGHGGHAEAFLASGAEVLAIDRDPDALAATLSEMIALVRRRGTELTDGEVRLSDFIVPHARASLREVAEWLSEARAEDGLIPG